MTTEWWWYSHVEHLNNRIFDIVDTIEGIVVGAKTATRRPSLAAQFDELHAAVTTFEAECRQKISGTGANPVPISGFEGDHKPPSD